MFKEADGTKCPNCQVEMENCNGTLITTDFPKAMTIEHIHPTSLGGTDDSENLCVMCHACNTARAHTLSDYLTTDTDEDIRRKTQFLHVQLDNQVHAWILFPDLHKKFRKHWERLTGYEWQVGRREVEDLVTQHTNPAILPRLSREKKVTSSPRIERGGRGRRTPHRRVDMSATARARRKRKRESAQET